MTKLPHTWARRRVTRLDLAVHGAVGGGLALLYLLPIPYEWFLYTPGESPLVWSYVSKLGHVSSRHLTENLLAFLTVSLFALTLATGAGKRRLYYLCFGTLLIIIPPLTGLLVGFMPEALTPPVAGGIDPAGRTVVYRGAGFSTVGASFLGLLAGAIALHQRELADVWLRPAASMGGLLALCLTYPAISYGWPLPLAMTLVACGVGYLVIITTHIRKTVPEPTANTPVMMSLFGTIYVVGVSITLFPQHPGTIGVGAHLLGLCAGFLVVWLVIALSGSGR